MKKNNFPLRHVHNAFGEIFFFPFDSSFSGDTGIFPFFLTSHNIHSPVGEGLSGVFSLSFTLAFSFFFQQVRSVLTGDGVHLWTQISMRYDNHQMIRMNRCKIKLTEVKNARIWVQQHSPHKDTGRMTASRDRKEKRGGPPSNRNKIKVDRWGQINEISVCQNQN